MMRKVKIFFTAVWLYARYYYIRTGKFFSRIGDWFRNIAFVYFTTRSEARTFSGFGNVLIAKRYADRRTKLSAINKYCGGKMHYVLPIDRYTCVVANSSEIDKLKAKGIFKKSLNIKTMLEMALYVSDNKVKKAS